MLGFPITIAGRTVTSQGGLAELLREDAHGGPLRGQDSHAAQAWIEAMDESPAAHDAVEHLLVELVGTESDPQVLAMITLLGGKVGGMFPEAAARRVTDGPPLPGGAGAQSATIGEDLRIHARKTSDAATRDRLEASGSPLDVLRMRLDERSASPVDAFEKAVKAKVDIPQAVSSRVAVLVAAKFPEDLVRAAKAAKGLPEGHRAAFLEEVVEIAPDARAKVESALGKKRGK